MDLSSNNTVIWAIDPVHSGIRFDAAYLMLSSVSGWFRDFEGTVETKGDTFADASIRLAIYTHSVYTGNAQRDAHLRSADFLNAASHPVIGFHSTAVRLAGQDLDIEGILSIKGMEHRQTINATYLGTVPDPMGNSKAAFSLDLIFNRRDFDITWNQVFDNNGLLLSNEVKLHADIQLLRLTAPV